jgi:hypothetical protein
MEVFMQRFELTQINAATGSPERAAEGVKFADGTCAVKWEAAVGKCGLAVFSDIGDIDKMYPGLTQVMIDVA